MNGKTKRNLYLAYMIIFGLIAVAGTSLLLYFACDEYTRFRAPVPVEFWVVVAVAIVCYVFLSPSVLVHEIGHLMFGAVAGMKFPFVTVGHFEFSRRGVRFSREAFSAGESMIYPARPEHVRTKLLCCSLGGIVANFLYGAVFLALYFVLPHTAALLFFELFAPVSLYEALLALYPIELPAGKTDGAVFSGLVKRDSSAQVALAVLTAQAVLNQKNYSAIPRELLFDTPVVQEDDAAFLALLQLRWRYLDETGDARAEEPLLRLRGLASYLPKENRAEVSADSVFYYAVTERDYARAALCGAELAEAKGGAQAIARYLLDRGTKEAAEREIEKEPLAGERERLRRCLIRAEKEKVLRAAELEI